jgi:hypothetical protein
MSQLELDAINPIRTDTWSSLHWVGAALTLGSYLCILPNPSNPHGAFSLEVQSDVRSAARRIGFPTLRSSETSANPSSCDIADAEQPTLVKRDQTLAAAMSTKDRPPGPGSWATRLLRATLPLGVVLLVAWVLWAAVALAAGMEQISLNIVQAAFGLLTSLCLIVSGYFYRRDLGRRS